MPTRYDKPSKSGGRQGRRRRREVQIRHLSVLCLLLTAPAAAQQQAPPKSIFRTTPEISSARNPRASAAWTVGATRPGDSGPVAGLDFRPGMVSVNRGLAPAASSLGAQWASKASTGFFMAADGEVSLAAFGDTARLPHGATDTIGMAGFARCEVAGKNCWALYGDVQFAGGSTDFGYGLELAIKNKGANLTSTANNQVAGTYGIALQAGGDPSYGGAPANPSNVAINIGFNASTWNTGIAFGAKALTLNRLTNAYHAIELGELQRINWTTVGNYQAAFIQSNVTAGPGNDVGLLFGNKTIRFFGPAGISAFLISAPASAVNYLTIRAGLTNSPVAITAVESADVNVDIALSPKGNGIVQSIGALALPILAASSVASAAAGFKNFFVDSATGRLTSKDSADIVIHY